MRPRVEIDHICTKVLLVGVSVWGRSACDNEDHTTRREATQLRRRNVHAADLTTNGLQCVHRLQDAFLQKRTEKLSRNWGEVRWPPTFPPSEPPPNATSSRRHHALFGKEMGPRCRKEYIKRNLRRYVWACLGCERGRSCTIRIVGKVSRMAP